MSGVPAMTIKDRYTMIHLRTDGIRYLLPFLGEDHKLHRLSLTVVDIVEHVVLYHHGTESEYHHIGTFQKGTELRDEETAADDDKVEEEQYGA